jgi:hypothetical protein
MAFWDGAIMTDSREAIWFKQVPEGYVFRAPNPWVFGRGKYFLVTEAQKAQLLSVLAARRQSRTLTIFLLCFAAMFGASLAAVAFIAGDTLRFLGIFLTIVVTLASIYAALLITAAPTARRVQPLLADLSPTDQRITAADRRVAAAKAIWLPSHLTLVASQMILSAMFFIQAIQRGGGNPANVFHSASTLSSAIAGCCFAFSSICLLIPALKKLRERKQESLPADQRFRKMLLPGFSLAISIVALGATIYAGQIEAKTEAAAAQRREKSFEISKRLGALQVRVDKSTAARTDIKARVAANSVRMKALVDKLNHPTVKCEPAAANDDPARQQDARDCTERARQEKQIIEAQIAATTREAAAIVKNNAVIEKDAADIKTEIAAIQTAMDANK